MHEPIRIFASYSTDPDYRLVRHTRRFLERIHQLPGATRLQLRPIELVVDGIDFVSHAQGPRNARAVQPADDEVIAAGISHHLDRCDYLLVFCSSNAKTSRWVGFELNWFLSKPHLGEDRVLLMATEGQDPGEDPDSIFRPEAVERGMHNRLWFDAREFRARRMRQWRKIRELDEELVRLASEVHNRLPPPDAPPSEENGSNTAERQAADEDARAQDRPSELERRLLTERDIGYLVQRDKRASQRRRTWVAVGFAVVLAVAAVVSNLYRERAEENERVARSRQLAAQATLAREKQLDLSLLLGVAAADTAETVEAQDALIGALSARTPVARYLRAHTSPAIALAARDDGSAFISGDMAGRLHLWGRDGQREGALDLADRVAVRKITWLGPDRVAVGDFAGRVHLLSTTPFALRQTLPAPFGVVGAAHVARIGKSDELVIGYGSSSPVLGGGGVVYRWRAGSPERDSEYLGSIANNIEAIAVSPEGKLLAIGTDEGLLGLLDLSISGATPAVRRVDAPGPARASYLKALAFAPDGTRLAVANGLGEVQVIDLATFESGKALTCQRHTNDVYQILFADSGTRILSVGSDGRLHVSELRNGRCDFVASYQATAKSLQSLAALDAAGMHLVSGSGDGSIVVWDLGQVDPLAIRTRLEVDLISQLQYARRADGMTISGLKGNSGFAAEMRLADLQLTFMSPGIVPGPTGGVVESTTAGSDFVFGPGGVRKVNRAQGTTELVLETEPVPIWPPAVTSDGKLTAFVNTQGVVRMMDLLTERLQWARTPSGAGRADRAIAIDHAGTTVAVGSESSAIYLLDGKSGESPRPPLEAHGLDVTGLAFSPDGKTLFSGGLDGQVIAWDARSGEILRRFENPDGAIQSLALSPDGALLAASTQRSFIGLWRTSDGARFGRFDPHLDDAVTALTFDGSGDRLAAADMQGNVAVWPIGPEQWRRIACKLAARELTDAEKRTLSLPPEVRPCADATR